MSGSDPDGSCNCKIGRQQREYGLERLGDEIVARRRNDDASLRALATYVNVQILDAAVASADADVAGDPRSIYQTLTGDDVSPERRADLEDQLNYVGVDVDQVRDDFVSHQTVKIHLNDCLNIDTSRDPIRSIADGRERIGWSRDRHRTILENTVDQLTRTDQLSIGDYELSQTTSITCTDCNRSYRLDEFLERQRCDCDT